jgi:hypothetical protein
MCCQWSEGCFYYEIALSNWVAMKGLLLLHHTTSAQHHEVFGGFLCNKAMGDPYTYGSQQLGS